MRFRKVFSAALSIFILVCVALASCEWPESYFSLSPQTRLPVFFDLPAGKYRTNLRVEMTYYNSSVQFELYEKGWWWRIASATGKRALPDPSKAVGSPHRYPSFYAVTVNGKTEIVEHRAMEPVFYISDDPDVRARFAPYNLPK
jgi:hypothetical protein